MYNKAIIMGRLTADPELRQTPSNISVTSFTVACDRAYSKGAERQTDFIDCVAWKKSLDDTNKTPLLKNSAEAFIQKRLIAGVREKSQMSGTFDRNSQLTLMFCAGAGDSARNDFRSLRQASSDFWDISVIADMINFISTESTNLFTAFSAATVTSLRSFHE